MKREKNRKLQTTVLVLLLTVSITLFALPSISAHDPPWDVPTYAYIVASPNPIGVGQTTVIVFWLDKVPPTAAGSGGERWTGLTIEVTAPDGSEETLGPFTSDPVGGGYTLYTPNQVGEYTFIVNFPGQVASLYNPETGVPGSPSPYIDDFYTASSATTKLTTQQDPIAEPLNYPQPTEYWSRPIEGHNTNWGTIASNWLGMASKSNAPNAIQSDGIAPNSPHIMWTKPLQNGGVVGGDYGFAEGMTYYGGLMYEGKFGTAMIIHGKLYYNLPRSSSTPGMFGGTDPAGGYLCVDLRTGEELWWRDESIPSFGQLYDYETFNQHGVLPNGYLWKSVVDPSNGGSVWMAIDPIDGKWLFNETNVPSDAGFMEPVQTVFGPNGEILRYNLNFQNNWLALWDNTAAHGLTGAIDPTDTSSSNYYQWRPVGKNVNASNAYLWNVTIPALPAGSSIIRSFYDDLILGRSGAWGGIGATNSYYTMWAISVKDGSRGELLWMKDYPLPEGNVTQNLGVVDAESRVFTLSQKETMTWCGYDLDTGELLWGPTEPQGAWDFYGTISNMMRASSAYGNMYYAGYGGILYCYELRTGNLLWTYGNGGVGNSTNSGLNTVYGLYPLIIGAIADGKVYMTTSEHSPNSPPIKGVRIRCVNATDGTEIWTMLGWGNVGMDGTWPIADGYMVYLNLYDMQVYSVGKGPSQTTVSASPKVTTRGSSVLIEGSVFDISAGTKQEEQAARFPNGVPALADESMGEWMEHVYMQKPCPQDAAGVKVHLTAIDPNGNFQDIGYATTDLNGNFGKMWTPPVPGEYHVTATFEGSNSYWPSYSTTYFGVTEASSPAQAIEPEPVAPASAEPAPVEPSQLGAAFVPTEPTPVKPMGAAETTHITTELAIIVIAAVACVISAVAFWALRKRK